MSGLSSFQLIIVQSLLVPLPSSGAGELLCVPDDDLCQLPRDRWQWVDWVSLIPALSGGETLKQWGRVHHTHPPEVVGEDEAPHVGSCSG